MGYMADGKAAWEVIGASISDSDGIRDINCSECDYKFSLLLNLVAKKRVLPFLMLLIKTSFWILSLKLGMEKV